MLILLLTLSLQTLSSAGHFCRALRSSHRAPRFLARSLTAIFSFFPSEILEPLVPGELVCRRENKKTIPWLALSVDIAGERQGTPAAIEGLLPTFT